MEQDIIGEIVHHIIYREYDGTKEAFEEFHRNMTHNEFLEAAYRMVQMNRMRG